METIPPESLLAAVPPPMRAIAEELRALVRAATPDAVERVRPGWRLIGYDLPIGPKRTAYFCFVLPESRHVHLGFENGVIMSDPHGVLQGAGVTKRVRWVTFREGDRIEPRPLTALVLEAARIARLPTDERQVALATMPAASG
jgi:hypothetical protein